MLSRDTLLRLIDSSLCGAGESFTMGNNKYYATIKRTPYYWVKTYELTLCSPATHDTIDLDNLEEALMRAYCFLSGYIVL